MTERTGTYQPPLTVGKLLEHMKATTQKPKGSFESELFNRAHQAGMVAGTGHTPEPMYLVERENPFDDTSKVIHAYEPVMDGVCGFAWVNVKPGTSRFARWIRANDKGRSDDYYGGTTVWVRYFDQSYERKLAYAEAFAEVLQEAGIRAYAHGRLD